MSIVQGAERVLRTAVRQVIPSLRLANLRGAGWERTKGDGSVVTATDVAVERSLVRAIRQGLPGVAVIAEEGGGWGGDGARDLCVLVDPCDGTIPLRVGAGTSTIGAALYSGASQSFLAAAVADLHGRVWYTEGGKTYCVVESNPWQIGASGRAVDQGIVLIDAFHGFRRTDCLTGEQRDVLTTQQVLSLVAGLNEIGSKAAGYGSNLYHQALVANGEAAVAQITTAIGGFWDLAGVQLVLNAGGCVCYLRFDQKRSLRTVANPAHADVVVTANNPATMSAVVAQIRRAVRR